MEPNHRFRTAVRGFYPWIGSTVLLGAAPLLALYLIDRETTLARAAAVAVGAGGMLPWMWVIYQMIRRGDEFVRRMHLIAFGFAFGATLVLLVALGWLVRADFMDPPDLIVVWAGCMVLWLVALLGAKSYFERAR
jgi:hypothetical protein